MMSQKYIKLPSALSHPKMVATALRLNDLTVIQANLCNLFTKEIKGSMYLELHTLYFVKKGKCIIKHGKISFEIGENQMLLLNKAVLVDYHKTGDETGVYENLLFFLTDEFITEFIKMSTIQYGRLNETMLPSVKTVNGRLQNFFQSISGYFTEPTNIDAGLIRLKLLELLYEISDNDKNLLQQLSQIKQQVRNDITQIMEENYMKPLSLKDFAYLSGRSLASFKRDFQATYNTSPSFWIRKKRLAKAKELLANTLMTITDICYTTGFENVAHFSKIYKTTFGITPSSSRNELKLNLR